jgi:hypothetical protein
MVINRLNHRLRERERQDNHLATKTEKDSQLLVVDEHLFTRQLLPDGLFKVEQAQLLNQ